MCDSSCGRLTALAQTSLSARKDVLRRRRIRRRRRRIYEFSSQDSGFNMPQVPLYKNGGLCASGCRNCGILLLSAIAFVAALFGVDGNASPLPCHALPSGHHTPFLVCHDGLCSSQANPVFCNFGGHSPQKREQLQGTRCELSLLAVLHYMERGGSVIITIYLHERGGKWLYIICTSLV